MFRTISYVYFFNFCEIFYYVVVCSQTPETNLAKFKYYLLSFSFDLSDPWFFLFSDSNFYKPFSLPPN